MFHNLPQFKMGADTDTAGSVVTPPRWTTQVNRERALIKAERENDAKLAKATDKLVDVIIDAWKDNKLYSMLQTSKITRSDNQDYLDENMLRDAFAVSADDFAVITHGKDKPTRHYANQILKILKGYLFDVFADDEGIVNDDGSVTVPDGEKISDLVTASWNAYRKRFDIPEKLAPAVGGGRRPRSRMYQRMARKAS